ncbi:MAG TPA: efflux RND transporter periplasmic adaptor subunit [Tepidisphaeraceae bacterium]|jgi:multidrug efflux system membrane fusion protein
MRPRTLTTSFVAPALLALILVGCKRNGAGQQMSMERPPAAVTVAPAVTQDVPLYLDQIGRTTATESVNILPQVTGKVMEVHFQDGAQVKKGDLLFTIDQRPFQAMLNQAQATLAQDQANVKLAESEFKRVQGLRGSGAVSQSDLDSKQNALAVAEAKAQNSAATIERAKLDVEYCTIRSPIDGRAGHRLIDPGNVVSNSGPDGGTKMLSIQKVSPIYADFTVPELDLQNVRSHMKNGTLAVNAWLPSEPNEVRQGQLTFLDNAVQNGSGTVMMRATLDNKDSQFWPGQFVNVRLILSTVKDAVLVPNQAAQIGQTGPFVFVVKEDSTAELRPITLGQRQGDLIVVAKGVTPGERVITVGQMMVMPGAKVQVLPPPQQQAAPAGAPAAEQASNDDQKQSVAKRQ